MRSKSAAAFPAAVILAAVMFMVMVPGARALPFNDDMVGGQLITGKVMRPKVTGSVPMGSLERRIENREAAEALTNPKPGEVLSIANGRRLYETNCSTCHGWFEGETYVPGPVGEYREPGSAYPSLPAPNIVADTTKARTDGFIFGYIHFGGMALMPAYGWKLSISEHWDIVNYVRHIQGLK